MLSKSQAQNVLGFHQLFVCFTSYVLAIGLTRFLVGAESILTLLYLCGALIIVACLEVGTRVAERVRILYLASWSFFAYFCLQSPVFEADEQYTETIYFSLKIAAIFFIVLFNIKQSKNFKQYNLGSLFILVVYLADNIYIKYYNLGITKTPTEWLAIWESVFVLIVLSALWQRFGVFNNSIVLVLFVIGHLANYWAAGFAKFNLDGGVFDWVVNNDTLATLKRAEIIGIYVPWSKFILSLDHLWLISLLGNILVYVGQLLSIVAPLFVSLLAPLTLFYDVFHVAVGLAAGVWFYKWIYINLLIYFYRKTISNAFLEIGRGGQLASCALIFISYWVASVVHLGWYETRQGAAINAYAEVDGEMVRLDHKFFASGSFHFLAKNYYLFDQNLDAQVFATPYVSIRELASHCENKAFNAINPSNESLKRKFDGFVSRFFDERSWVEEFALFLQPYHVFLPQEHSIRSVLSIDQNKVSRFKFVMTEYCFDDSYEITKERVIGEYEIKR